jgi:protein-disulfide isomerase
VVIVSFDDLECPFCAKMHSALFPAVQERYKDQVRIVYQDFPLAEIHPWAMRAAVNANCLAAQNGTAYWSYVDYVHEHFADVGGSEKTLAKANETLDTQAREAGKAQKVSEAKLNQCIEKQDDTEVKSSIKLGTDLGIDGTTPTLFINGERLTGALPVEYVYRMIDRALVAAGLTPPPPIAPAQQGTPATGAASQPGSPAGGQK